MTHTLRSPCLRCGGTTGTLRPNGPHTEALCAGCGRHCYFVKKTITGEVAPPPGFRRVKDAREEKALAALESLDSTFAQSLFSQHKKNGYLSEKQWLWVGKLANGGGIR